MRIYVGNLAATTTDEALGKAFSVHGAVESSRLAKDKDSGALRGFGFVEMSVDTEANAAIAALHGSVLDGNTLRVTEAKAKAEANGSDLKAAAAAK